MTVRKIKTFTFLALSILFLNKTFALPPQEQNVPYHSYTYGTWGTAVPTAPAYEPESIVNGYDLGIGPFAGAEDMCRDTEGNICILDSGNRRVVKINTDMELVDTIDFASLKLVEPQGFCFDKEGKIYIADKGAKAVFVCTPQGTLIRKIIKPVSDIIDERTDFAPVKCLVDSNMILYVLSFGSFEGAYTFDEAGDFLGFFGSNKVNVTQQLLSDRFWRLFATSAQRERMYRYVPIEYKNFCIDKDNFIYTVSNFGEQETEGQVKKLNPLSKNILFLGQKPDMQFFGDTDTTYTNRVERSNLVAVDVDEYGFISVLDKERGRIFQYDNESYLLTIFGGTGNQTGSFNGCTDIVSAEDCIYVMDGVKNNITKFHLTDYGQAIRKATVLFNNGFYEEALEPWFEAFKADRTNYAICLGIGRAYERLKMYKEAMHYYRLGELNGSYSKAFKEYRTQYLRKHFSVVMTVIILLLLIPVFKIIWRKFRPKKTGPVDHAVYVTKMKFPFYLCIHPFKGYEELKHEKQGMLWFSNVVIIVWFIMEILLYQYTGFQFNGNRLDRMNIFIIFASTIGFHFLWSVCNWAVCTLFDGKGSFKEVWIFSSYARLPYVLVYIPVLILTNVLVRDEYFFLSLIENAATIWFAVSTFVAIKSVHQYSFWKTVGSILLTVLGMVLVVLILLLFVSLFAQMYSFLQTIFQEILMRL